MKFSAGIIIFSIVFAVIYGVLFSSFYPLTIISSALAALFAVLGLATSLIIGGVWTAITKRTRPK
jgi:uncharacterized membrane protein YagU involved in acid resistance